MKYVKIIFRDERTKPVHLSLEGWGKALKEDRTLVPYLTRRS